MTTWDPAPTSAVGTAPATARHSRRRDRMRDLRRVQTVEQRIEDGVRRIGTFVKEGVAAPRHPLSR